MAKLLITTLLISTSLLCCTTNTQKRKSELPNYTTGFSVNGKDSNNKAIISYFKFDKDSITVLPFEIAIVLSPKAKDKIISNNETIIIHVSLTGAPKDKKLISKCGDFYVASADKEIIYGQIAKFDNIKFSKKVYDQLIDKDVSIDVFFYSGRKSSKDNLLSGNSLFNNISNVVTKRFELTGKLIYGDN